MQEATLFIRSDHGADQQPKQSFLAAILFSNATFSQPGRAELSFAMQSVEQTKIRHQLCLGLIYLPKKDEGCVCFRNGFPLAYSSLTFVPHPGGIFTSCIRPRMTRLPSYQLAGLDITTDVRTAPWGYIIKLSGAEFCAKTSEAWCVQSSADRSTLCSQKLSGWAAFWVSEKICMC